MKNNTSQIYSTARIQATKILSLVILSFILMSVSPLRASEIIPGEQAKITGKVSDAFTGKPMATVSVTVKDSKAAAVKTNEKGEFTLVLPKNAKTLVFTLLGYQTLEVSIGSKTTFEIEMSVVEIDPTLW